MTINISKKVASLLSDYPEIKQKMKKMFYVPGAMLSRYKVAYYSISPDISTVSESDEDCFFGYHDESPVSAETGELLYHKLNQNSEVEIVITSKGQQNTVATSKMWNYQQGARLLWVPRSGGKFIHNTLINGQLRSVVMEQHSDKRTFLSPVAAISGDGAKIASCDFNVITDLNAEYGYPHCSHNDRVKMQDVKGSLWVEDITNAKTIISISLKEILNCDSRNEFEVSKHEINHLNFSPCSEQLAFIHRWYPKNGKRKSRLLMVNLLNSKIRNIMDEGMVSHYCWVSGSEIFVYGQTFASGAHFYSIDLEKYSSKPHLHKPLLNYGDGHPSYCADNKLIVFDSYPDWQRYQYLYIYSPDNEDVREIGKFRSPLKYFGPNRCDLHPRWAVGGEQVAIDVCYKGHRDLMLVHIAEYVKKWQT